MHEITIPGLDGEYCPICGWLLTEFGLKEIQTRLATTKGDKPYRILSVELSTATNKRKRHETT